MLSWMAVARSRTCSGLRPPRGWGMATGLKLEAPKVLAWRRAEFMKGSVQTTMVGIPPFSRVMASCTLHAVQDPQSAIAVTTKSHLAARVFIISWAAGLE